MVIVRVVEAEIVGRRDVGGGRLTRTSALADGGPCNFIALVNIGRNQVGSDRIWMPPWEIVGSLVEKTALCADVAAVWRVNPRNNSTC
jgi:hypothetical protein